MILPLLINLLLIIASAQNCPTDDGFLNGFRTCHADTTILSSILPTSYATSSRHALKFGRFSSSLSQSWTAALFPSSSPLSSIPTQSHVREAQSQSQPRGSAPYSSRPWNWSHGAVGLSGYLYFSGHEDFRQLLLHCRAFAARPSGSGPASTLEKGLCLSRAARFGAGALFYFGLGDATLDVLRVLVGRKPGASNAPGTAAAAAASRSPSSRRQGVRHQVIVRREPAKATRASTLFATRGTLETGMVPGG